jgi:hypothetical protein
MTAPPAATGGAWLGRGEGVGVVQVLGDRRGHRPRRGGSVRAARPLHGAAAALRRSVAAPDRTPVGLRVMSQIRWSPLSRVLAGPPRLASTSASAAQQGGRFLAAAAVQHASRRVEVKSTAFTQNSQVDPAV